MNSRRRALLGNYDGETRIRMATGSVTPKTDATYIVIPEDYSGAQAFVISTEWKSAYDAGANTVYAAKGLIATGTELNVGQNVLYIIVNSNLGTTPGATGAEQHEDGIKVPVSANKYWRAGLEYKYTVYYWEDETK